VASTPGCADQLIQALGIRKAIAAPSRENDHAAVEPDRLLRELQGQMGVLLHQPKKPDHRPASTVRATMTSVSALSRHQDEGPEPEIGGAANPYALAARPPWAAIRHSRPAPVPAADPFVPDQVLSFYRADLMNPHWGERLIFRFGRELIIRMVFQGLDQVQAAQAWQPFFDWVAARPADYTFAGSSVSARPARLYWNAAVLEAIPGDVKTDDRPGAPKGHFFWSGDTEEVGWVLHDFQSTWLSQELLEPERRPALVDALVRCADTWGVELALNKGLAGAPAAALARTKDTAMNPAVLDAFALAIIGGGEPPAYPGIPGHEPDLEGGRRAAKRIRAATAPLLALSPKPASYVWETDYFEPDWQTAFWGDNYARLKSVKDSYDPDGLFFIHHGVGSEAWSADGFTKVG